MSRSSLLVVTNHRHRCCKIPLQLVTFHAAFGVHPPLHHNSCVVHILRWLDLFINIYLPISHRDCIGCSWSSIPSLHDSLSTCGISLGGRCTYSCISRRMRRSSPPPWYQSTRSSTRYIPWWLSPSFWLLLGLRSWHTYSRPVSRCVFGNTLSIAKAYVRVLYFLCI